jgi:hypothetical protein
LTRAPKTVLAASLAVLVAAVAIAYSLRGRDGDARLQRLEAELAQANAKLGALERRPPMVVVPAPTETSGTAAATVAAGATPGSAAGAAAAGPAARQPRRDPDAPRRVVEKMAAAMDQRLAAEERDATWSGATEQALRTGISERAAGSKLLDVQCRKTLCRLLVRHESLANKKGFASSLGDAEPFQGGVMFRYGDETSGAVLETSVYVVREGYSMQGDPRTIGQPF